ncbi:MAG: glycosyltransferase family 2 protein [Pseudolabrys sp.]|nr:glycosyltransferase family 2 protein [Pseudolabrys sp.]
MNQTEAGPAFAIVIPVNNEAENIVPLVAEIEAALGGGRAFELIFVNDGSTDETDAILTKLAATRPWLRQIKHSFACGKSAALRTGVRMARAQSIVMLDGDGQNDPKYIPPVLAALEQGGDRVGLVNSVRIGRKDTEFKRIQSRIANRIRGALLKDGTRDSVSGLKAFRREVFLSLPFFDGLHRFMPALARREGLDLVQVDVVDRPRMHGDTHYGMWNRLWVGILDLAGVWWLIRRKKHVPKIVKE